LWLTFPLSLLAASSVITPLTALISAISRNIDALSQILKEERIPEMLQTKVFFLASLTSPHWRVFSGSGF